MKLSSVAFGAFVGIGIIIAVGMAAKQPDHPKMKCAPKDTVLSTLLSRFEEKPAWEGTVGGGDGTGMMLTENSDGTSWTMLLTDGDIACIFSAGDHSIHHYGATL